jgi:hypothetical protein
VLNLWRLFALRHFCGTPQAGEPKEALTARAANMAAMLAPFIVLVLLPMPSMMIDDG